jgi:hypothetical protein
MKAVLLVTWIVSGSQPDSYQFKFSSAQACEAARSEVLTERERIMSDFSQRRQTTPVVAVSAICVAP